MFAGTTGCGTLVSPSTLISMATSLVGGYANGAVMGGSVVGVIRDQAADREVPPKQVADSAKPQSDAPAEEPAQANIAELR
jgi:hypothetical protein